MIGSANRAVSYFRQHGVSGFAKELYHRLYTRRCEAKYNVSTSGGIEPRDLGIDSPDAKPYWAIGYQHIFWAMKRIPFPAEQVVFVDYGSGKGRALVAAATRPFKRVIGIELSEMLVQQARKNIAAMKGKEAQQVDVVQADATVFAVPDDANVIYFFNPFGGETLSRVISNIYQSHQQHKRDIFIIFFNNDHFEARRHILPGLRKLHQGKFYPDYSCGLYQLDAAAAQTHAASVHA